MEKTASGLRGFAGRAARLLVAACVAVLGLPLGLLAPAAQADEGAGGTDTRMSVSGEPDHSLCDVGDSFELSAVVKTRNGVVVDGATCVFESSDSSVVSVSGAQCSALSMGTAKITVSFAGDSTYAPSQSSVTVTVYGGKIESGGLTAHVTSYAQAGSPGACLLTSISADAISSDGEAEIPGSFDSDGASYAVTAVGLPASNRFAYGRVARSSDTALTSVSLPASVTEVRDYAFYGESNLERVTWASGSALTSIGTYAFGDCSSLVNAADFSGSELSSIGSSAFCNCTKLADLSLPEGLSSIGDGAFYGCSSIEALEIPGSVSTVGSTEDWRGAFGACSSLRSLTIGAGDGMEIGANCFKGCAALESLSIGEGVTSIGGAAFMECPALSGIVALPASLQVLGVYGGGSFQEDRSITSVTVAAGSKLSSATRSFANCTGLLNVDISACSALESSERMFSDCTALRTVAMPDAAGAFGSSLAGCAAIETLTVPEGSAEVSQVASGEVYLAGGSKLLWYPPQSAAGSLVLPESCSSIGDYALADNASLKSVAMTCKGDAGAIGEGAFQGCSSLESLAFSCRSLAHIDSYAFDGCTSLKSVAIPALTGQKAYSDYYTDRGNARYSSGYIISTSSTQDTVETPGLGRYSFQNCTSLESVSFAAGADCGCYALVDRQSGAFYGCDSLKRISFGGRQPYWMDLDASIGCTVQGSGFNSYACYCDYFTYGSGSSATTAERPDFYYAVDYYLTEDAAKADDAYGSNRVGRAQYARGSSVSAIATGDAGALSGSLFEGAVAEDGYQDGKVLDPNAVAEAAGMGGSGWVWAFEDHYGEYSDLYDSCYVYLARADDLSAGRAYAAPLSSMREPIRSNISEEFDAARWFGENKWDERYDPTPELNGDVFVYSDCFDNDKYNYGGGYGSANHKRFDGSCYFTWGSQGLMESIDVTAADGTALEEGKDYAVSMQRASYADGKVVLEDVSAVETTGPYLLTFTALEGGKCTAGTSFSRWILVKHHSSTVSVYDQTGGKSAAYTEEVAERPSIRKNGATVNTNIWNTYTAPYKVYVSENDAVSALFGAEIAGLAKAQITIDNSNIVGKETKGFAVSVDNGTKKWTRDEYSDAEMAVFTYNNLNEKKTDYGFSAGENIWGDTALLCAPEEDDNLSSLGSYSYQNKAPVFFLTATGELDDATLACLKDFDKVIVVGDESVISGSVEESVEKQASAQATRISYAPGDAGQLSIGVVQKMLDEGADLSLTAVCDGKDQLEAIAALNNAGFVGGGILTASSTAEAKRLVAYLYSIRDEVSQVRIYGRSDGTFADYDIAAALMPNGWDADVLAWDGTDSIWAADAASVIAEKTALGAGDTLCRNGMLLTLGKDGKLSYEGTNFYGNETIAKGDELVFEDYAVDADSGAVEISEKTWQVESVPEGYRSDTTLGLSASQADLTAGETVEIGLSTTSDGVLEATSSDEKVAAAMCEDGKLVVKGVGYGDADITVTASETEVHKAATATLDVHVSRADQAIEVASAFSVHVGDAAFNLNAKALGDAQLTYSSDDESVATVDTEGNVTPLAIGTAHITIAAKRTDAYKAGQAETTVTVSKVPDKQNATAKAGKITAKTSSKTVTYKKAKKGKFKGKLAKKKTISAAKFKKLFGISALGNPRLSYARASVPSKAKKFITVAKNGKVTIKKGLKKGTYKIKVKISAAATSAYTAASKTVTLKVKVK